MLFEYKDQSLKSGIYQIRNLKNGKVYIGSAKRFKERGKAHLNSLKKGKHHNKHLQKAFNKDGTDNFLFEVLEVVQGDKLVRTTKEKEYLDQVTDWSMCYNFQKNPLSQEPRINKDTETLRRQKISEASKKLWQNPDHKLQMAKTARENAIEQWQDPEFVKKMNQIYQTDESKKSKSEHFKKIWQSSEHQNYMKMAIKESWTEERKEKAKEAGEKFRHTEKTKQQISQKHKGKVLSKRIRQKISERLKKQFFTQETKDRVSERCKNLWLDQKYREKMVAKIKKRCCKPIFCKNIFNDKNQKFESIAEAAKILGLNECSIRDCVKGRVKLVKKQYKFEYC